MIYLIHFNEKLRHAQHYIGFCEEGKLDRRIKRHREGKGAKLLAAINKVGIGWDVVRTWKGGTRDQERQMKKWKKASRICPVCLAVRKKTAQEEGVGERERHTVKETSSERDPETNDSPGR